MKYGIFDPIGVLYCPAMLAMAEATPTAASPKVADTAAQPGSPKVADTIANQDDETIAYLNRKTTYSSREFDIFFNKWLI